MEEFLKALEMIKPQPTQVVEYRLYYNEEGYVTMFCETDHPTEGNYIVIDNPDVFFKNNTMLMRVVNGKLKILSAQPKHYTGLTRSTTGQRVVKGMAALALLDSEEYQDVEYYDRKTNN